MEEQSSIESFVLYTQQSEIVNELSNEQAEQLLKGIYSHAAGEEPNLTGIVQIAFISIRQQLDRNAEKYEAKKEKLRLNGSKGGKPKKTDNEEKPKKANGFQENQMVNLKSKKSLYVNVNDNVNVINKDKSLFIDNNENQTKNSDPTVNPVIEKFTEEYKKYFNSKPFLNYTQKMKLIEIASDNHEFKENIPLLMEKFSRIEFEFKDVKKKPGLNWLIDKGNWSGVLNGDFNNQDKINTKEIDGWTL